MIKSTLVLSLLLTTAAFAQRGTGTNDIGAEAQRLAAEVQRESRYLNRGQASQILNKFQEIRDILYRQGPGPVLPPQQANYSCIARDNDNRAPWVYALRDGINMIRIQGVSFNSVESCQSSIQNARQINNLTMTCTARDNDDRAPVVFTRLEGQQISKLNNILLNSVEDCRSLMDRMLVVNYNNDVALCKARDNDNRAPFVAVNMNLASGQQQLGTELFQDIESCWRFLGN